MKKLILALALFSESALATIEIDPFNVPTFASAAALPAPSPDGSTAVTLDTHDLYIYNAGTATWAVVSGGGGGGMVVGDVITGGTAKSVLYVGAGGVLAQDSAFAWDYTNHRLGIGTSSPSNPLQLVHAGTTGTAVVIQATDTSNSGNGVTIQKSGTGRGMLIQQTASGTGRGLEVTSSNAANTQPVVVITGTHGGQAVTATSSPGAAAGHTATFSNISTTATGVSGGVYGSVRTSASSTTAGVIGEVAWLLFKQLYQKASLITRAA